MKDVANLAGVGVGTVSRFINGTKVKDSTYQKVSEAIKTLDFIPDETARGLKSSMTNTVALILPPIWHPFFSDFAYTFSGNVIHVHDKVIWGFVPLNKKSFIVCCYLYFI